MGGGASRCAWVQGTGQQVLLPGTGPPPPKATAARITAPLPPEDTGKGTEARATEHTTTVRSQGLSRGREGDALAAARAIGGILCRLRRPWRVWRHHRQRCCWLWTARRRVRGAGRIWAGRIQPALVSWIRGGQAFGSRDWLWRCPRLWDRQLWAGKPLRPLSAFALTAELLSSVSSSQAEGYGAAESYEQQGGYAEYGQQSGGVQKRPNPYQQVSCEPGWKCCGLRLAGCRSQSVLCRLDTEAGTESVPTEREATQAREVRLSGHVGLQVGANCPRSGMVPRPEGAVWYRQGIRQATALLRAPRSCWGT